MALLHGIGNTWPLFANLWAVSGAALLATLAGVAAVYFGAALAYRHWMDETDRSPGNEVRPARA